MKNLVIVESPAKAKTIEKYLGKEFHVLSSVGHIRSIVKKTKDGTPPIDVANDFFAVYEVDPEKKKVISELKKNVKAVGKDNVWLATDEDREGEAIAWHLCKVLDLPIETTKRIVFHEITKDAITTAIKNPRTVDMNLVQAQQARQILDRLVGFELSPVVWQKVPGGKSAGRVQSPAVRLLVEREREIMKFAGSSQFKVTAIFIHDNQEFKAELNQKFDSEAAAHEFLNSLKPATFTVSDISKTPGTRNPAAPFTTSTLQQEANAKLGFSSKATMASAQRLYQDGKITYMRTDSVNLSGQAIASATDFIKRLYGPDYSTVRKFKTKSASAQEAHEAIRPTDITRETVTSNEYDQKLYDLIRRRTLASQMSAAKLEKTTVTICIEGADAALPEVEAVKRSSKAGASAERSRSISSGDTSEKSTPAKNSAAYLVFEAKGEVITFDGFLRVYGGGKDEILPKLHSGDTLETHDITARQTFARPPARYTEGSLVKKLEDLGIGRPSTYATIIDTVQTRGYVEKGDSEGQPRDVIVLSYNGEEVSRDVVQEKTGSTRGKLIPTPSGELIADFLTDHFTQIVDYDFTANVETEFDKIAAANLAKSAMLNGFYTPFHKLIEQSGGIDRSKVGANREVGIDPKSGKPILARFGRFGPMLQLGATDDEDKPRFAPLPKGAKIETVTLEQALEMFKLPRVVGQTEDGQDIKANIGRFGPYIQVGKLFVSIKPEDPHTITLETARELYAAKLQAEAEKNIADFGDGVKVLNGRFGPYITDGTKNAKIPKDIDPKTITHEQALELLKAAPAKPARRGRTSAKSKTAAKKSTTRKKS
ncbi:DNA topoisomerase [Candidatus Nanosynbacter featherlites]|uniref:DNA topoisomerase 1 n=1 Tax=Candidatus Nanosynbacter featherlites TaxID=2572088 RepID=A0A4P9A2X5_9BACT|nr:DNA topoisomerase [Candidatus Nanosynbacter featherlites]QCT42150.1 type I DNA topoisomerase [Candidatus Nanosynbacter featherlites]